MLRLSIGYDTLFISFCDAVVSWATHVKHMSPNVYEMWHSA